MPAMTDAPRLTSAKKQEQAAREARLAKALRDNLRRRKEQARARSPGREPSGVEATEEQRDRGEPSA